MATLLELALQNKLHRLDPVLRPSEQEIRYVYMLPHVKCWLEKTLPTLHSTWNIEENPAEQLDALMEIFCSGKLLWIGQQFKPLTPLANAIWELKTADLRIFGWFPQQDIFIASDCNHVQYVKQHGLYNGYCGQAVRFRNTLDLDEPKFIAGDDYHVVVSNCC